jgi:hypothetical protein
VNEQTCEQTVRRGPIAVKGGFTQTEEPCGAPATVESGQTLCRRHREQQDREAFDTGQDDIGVLRRAFGVPGHIETLKRCYPGETLFSTPAQRDARVEVVAFRLPDNPGPVVSPWAYEEFPGIAGPCLVARWRFRLPGKPGFLDVTWDRHRKGNDRFRRSVIIDGLGKDGLGVAPEHVVDLWNLYPPKAEDGLRAKISEEVQRRQAAIDNMHYQLGHANHVLREHYARKDPGRKKVTRKELYGQTGMNRSYVTEQVAELGIDVRPYLRLDGPRVFDRLLVVQST